MKVYGLRKKTEDSFKVQEQTREKIQTYGEDNLYPQTLHRIIQSSPTGSGCLERYATFIEGDGFNDLAFAEMTVNSSGQSMDTLHSLICSDLAEFGGFAVHVNYNALGQIVELHYVPFEQCRLAETDDRGYTPYIVVCRDWDRGRMRKSKNGQVKKFVAECDYIYRFNPIREVVMEQIEASGGIDFYKGQILWFSTAGDDTYPVPRADRVATSMSTDEGLCNIQWRNVRCNFAPAGLLFTKKGQGGPFAPKGSERISAESGNQADFSDAITSVQGDTNTAKIVVVELESDEDKPTFEKLANANYDKEFTVTEESTTAKIYSAFQQEPWYCIKTGKVGFSGDILTDAFDYYSSIVSKEQRYIERIFDLLMKHWGGEYAGVDHSVKPLRYISSASKATAEL